MKRFESLDSFRGIICIFVVLFHLKIADSFLLEWNFLRFVPYMIMYFFILSGFVMSYSYGDITNCTFIKYIRARFFRLFPLHIMMFMIIVGGEFIKTQLYKYNILEFNNLGFNGHTAYKEWIPNILLLQSWLPFTDIYSINYPSWSISVDFYLYIIFYFVIAIFRLYKLMPSILIVLITGYFLYTNPDTKEWIFPVKFGMFYFFCGVLLYEVYKKLKDINLSYITASVLEVVIFSSLICISYYDFINKGVVVSLLFLLLVLVFSFDAGICSKLLNNSVLRLLSKISYSVYLTHTFIIYTVVLFFIFIQKYKEIDCTIMIGKERYLSTGSWLGDNLLLIGIVLAVIIFSVFSNKYVEQKWQYHCKSRSDRLKK